MLFRSAYIALSGTSVAAPMVSGAVALMLQQTPGLTPDQVKLRLMSSADKNLPKNSSSTDSTTGQVFYSQADIFTVGAGNLNVGGIQICTTPPRFTTKFPGISTPSRDGARAGSRPGKRRRHERGGCIRDACCTSRWDRHPEGNSVGSKFRHIASAGCSEWRRRGLPLPLCDHVHAC